MQATAYALHLRHKLGVRPEEPYHMLPDDMSALLRECPVHLAEARFGEPPQYMFMGSPLVLVP